jgi:hypothetical protein
MSHPIPHPTLQMSDLVKSTDESVPLVEPQQNVHAPLEFAEPQMQRRHTEIGIKRQYFYNAMKWESFFI